MITGLYAAIFAFVQAVMVVWIAKTRMKEQVSLGDGDNPVIQTKSRVYGNFVEIVPMALILMALAEFGGAPLWCVHGMGGLMVVSRLSHGYGLLKPPGYGVFRMVGMVLSMGVYLIGAGLCFWLALF